MWNLIAALLVLPQEPSPQEFLEAVIQRIEKAKTVRATSESTMTTSDGRTLKAKWSTLLKGNDRWFIESRMMPDPWGASFLAVSDGKRVRIHGHNPAPARSMPPGEVGGRVRKELALCMDGGWFSSGMPEGLHRPPDVGEPRDGGRLKVGDRDTRVLEFSIVWWLQAGPRKDFARVAYDLQTRLPLKIDVASDHFTWSERVTEFSLDLEVPDSAFEFPWRRLQAQARVNQLAESVGNFAFFTGRFPRSPDNLLRKPDWLEADTFYPEGGFVLGGRLPQDPWGRAFEFTEGKVSSLGADGKAGGSGENEDVSGDCSLLMSHQRIAAPSDRLKKQFNARLQLHLLSASVRAYYGHTGSLPKLEADLLRKPDGVEAWPEGGWVGGSSLPKDPWGNPYQYVSDGKAAVLKVLDPFSRRLRRGALTPAELGALEAAARPKVKDTDAKEIRRIIDRCIDDDIETREAGRKEAVASPLESLFSTFLEARRTELRDPDRIRWLEELRTALPVRQAPWRSELRVLVFPIGSSSLDVAQPQPIELGAFGALQALVSAQMDFRANDRDKNGVPDFWTGDVAGLHTLLPKGLDEPIRLIEASLAAADAAPLKNGPGLPKETPAGPRTGYVFRALALPGTDARPGTPAPDRHLERFAFAAFPKPFSGNGRLTFIVSEANIVYAMDLGGEAPGEWPTDEELAAEWRRLN